MLAENLKLARPYLVMLAIVALGRWLQGVFEVPYQRGHHVFSILTLTIYACLFCGAFLRRWRGFRLLQAVGFGFLLGVICQLLILVLTVASYGLGLETYFNHPVALNATEAVPFGGLHGALVRRLGGLVGNSIFAGIGGALGWALGGLLPER